MTNIKFKNTVFTTLFADPDLLRELYGALEGISVPPDAPVSINTLEDVLFMDFFNDISFEIDGKLVVLIEHQSTINPNMALRLLMYIARVYEKILEGVNIYTSKKLVIPRPEFFVLYNGTAPFPEKEIYRLSDSFWPSEKAPALELEVKVFNINEGQNKEIAQRCKKLAEYSAFVAKERELKKKHGNFEKALKETVKYCQKHDILKEYLELHGTEVLSMLMTEWNWDDALAVRYEEGKEDGLEEGLAEGLAEARKEKLQIARNALAKGATPEFVQDITGLDLEVIKELQN